MKTNNFGEFKPTIPIEAIDLLIFPGTGAEEREQDGTDRFFEQLLDRLMLMMISLHQMNISHFVRAIFVVHDYLI